jgi:hypothetical protein
MAFMSMTFPSADADHGLRLLEREMALPSLGRN